MNAAKYFPWPYTHYPHEYGAPPPPRPLASKVHLSPRLLAYQAQDTPDGQEVNGVVYSTYAQGETTNPRILAT
jgi:hypothetical protein